MADVSVPPSIGVRRKPLIAMALLSFTVGLAILVGIGLPNRASYSGLIINDDSFAPEMGSLAPPFTAETRAGEPLDLMAQRGKPVILNFWATWCLPCEAELPELQSFQSVYGDSAQLIALNTGEVPEWANAWLDTRQLTLDVAYDPDAQIASLYRLRGQPTTFIIAPNGMITTIFYGPITRQQLETALEPYI